MNTNLHSLDSSDSERVNEAFEALVDVWASEYGGSREAVEHLLVYLLGRVLHGMMLLNIPMIELYVGHKRTATSYRGVCMVKPYAEEVNTDVVPS